MKIQMFFVVLLLSLTSLIKSTYAQKQKTQWAKGNTSMSLYSMSTGNAIAADLNGNVITAGSFFDTCDFNPGAGIYNLTEHEGRPDIYIQKLDASGNFVWARRIGGEYDQDANAIAIDKSGNAYIAGYFEDTIDFDPGASVFRLMTAARNIFILKLDMNGNFVWAKSFYGTAFDVGHALVLDADANIYLTGAFMGNTDFDPNAGTLNYSSNGPNGLGDVFIAKLSTDGNLIWAKQIGGPADDIGYGIALDDTGNVLVTGQYAGTADFDPNTGTKTMTAVNGEDVFILKLDASGNFVWAKSVGGTWADIPCAIALDKSKNIYIGGDFGVSSFVQNATCDFDPGPGVFTLTTNSYSDLFLLKLKPAGDFEWAKRIGGTTDNQERMIEVHVDDSGYLYATGYFCYTMDFDPNAGVYNLKATDRYITNRVADFDIFISKYKGDGNLIWAQNFGGEMHDLAGSITTDKKGNIYATGSYQDTAYFFPEDSTKILLSGFQGSYVLKIGQGYNITNVPSKRSHENFSLYPNPNNGTFTITAKNKGTYSIVNQMGQTVRTITTDEHPQAIKIEHLPAGIYFILGHSDETVFCEKIIVSE